MSCHSSFSRHFKSYSKIVPIEPLFQKKKVNGYGKICHPLLDRQWTSDNTARTALDAVFGLLLTPDYGAAVESNTALDARTNRNAYEAEVRRHVMENARKKTREGLRTEYEGGAAKKK